MPALRSAAALAGAVLFGAALTGCSSPRAGHPAADPAQALKGALAGIDAGRYTWDVSFPNGHLLGAVDQPGRQGQWSETLDQQPGRMVSQTRVIGTDLYVTNTNLKPAGVWEHYDLTEAPASDGDPLTDPQLAGIAALVGTMTATSIDGDVLRGTLTLSRMKTPPVALTELAKWWDVGPLPATVQLDQQGRLVRLTTELPATGPTSPAGPLTVQLSRYGGKVAPIKPHPTVEQ